ncbi:MAG: succinyldiaminopimelate transaminase [Candidatus Nanopelagicales bacterium]
MPGGCGQTGPDRRRCRPGEGSAAAGGGSLIGNLPEFPWDRLIPAKQRAAAHPGGIVDLSVGTPVDPTPEVVRAALDAAGDSPGYPLTAGSEPLRAAITEWVRATLGAQGDFGVLPAIGTKELVAWLPILLGLGLSDTVVIPEIAYPTYDVGARLAGAQIIAADSLTALGPARPSLLWLNSPSNPTGKVLPVEHLAKVVDWARQRGTLVISDECYFELPWQAQPVSILHPDVCGGDATGVLALHSLSKRSNLAGYRFGFAAGDPAVLARVLEVRKHAGMMVPGPIQAAAIAALADVTHVVEQRRRYRARRELLLAALLEAGWRIEHSEAGLYLWATRDEPCWQSVEWMAERGVLVAPGEFYGPAGARHIRIALTATDERVEAAAMRLAAG